MLKSKEYGLRAFILLDEGVFFNSYANFRNLAGAKMITICNLLETANRKYNCCYKTRENHENILNKTLSSDL